MDMILQALTTVGFWVGVAYWIRWLNQRDATRSTKQCRYCKMAIPANASACPHCTRALTIWRRIIE